MKKFLIAQMQKVFAFFFLFAFFDASLNDGIVSQSIKNSGNEPIVSLMSSDKSYYLEKEHVGSEIETTIGVKGVENENLALNSQRKSRVGSGKEKHRFVLPVVKLTTAHPEY